VIRLLSQHPGIGQVVLTGSGARGRARPWSNWDFTVSTTAFAEAREALPPLVAALRPVVAHWDRLARRWCYMLILDGPVKVDLIFTQPHTPLPPRQVSAATLPRIDDHFWDWMLWLHAKHAAGRQDLVAAELGKLHEYLLAPMGSRRRQQPRPHGHRLSHGPRHLGTATRTPGTASSRADRDPALHP
jgi:hypothetical protein